MNSLNSLILNKFSTWFGAISETDSNWHRAVADSISESALAIGKTGMAVAAILGIVLDNIVPGTREERGLIDASDSSDESK